MRSTSVTISIFGLQSDTYLQDASRILRRHTLRRTQTKPYPYHPSFRPSRVTVYSLVSPICWSIHSCRSVPVATRDLDVLPQLARPGPFAFDTGYIRNRQTSVFVLVRGIHQGKDNVQFETVCKSGYVQLSVKLTGKGFNQF